MRLVRVFGLNVSRWCFCGAQRPRRSARRLASASSASTWSSRSIWPPGSSLQHLLADGGNVGEADLASEERGDRDFVGGVQDRAGAAARPQRLARDAQRREADLIRRFEGQLPDLAEIQTIGRRRDALGPAQRVGDRRAHVRAAELRQHRAVAIRDHAVDDRLRMHQDLDLLVRQPEQVVRLDQLEALVHHGRRIRPRSWRPCSSSGARPPAPASSPPSRPATSGGTVRPRRSG